MKSLLLSGLMTAVMAGAAWNASAANLNKVTLINSSGKLECFPRGFGCRSSFGTDIRVDNIGPHHICRLRASTDGWKTSFYVKATFQRFELNSELWSAGFSGDDGAGGKSFGSVSVIAECDDLSQKTSITSGSATLTSERRSVSSTVSNFSFPVTPIFF